MEEPMKKTIPWIILGLILIVPYFCFAAFNVATQWEYNTATGNDANGGGYAILLPNTGSDTTYPTSSPIAYDDILIGTAGNETTATSIDTPFTTAHVGNIVNITAGTNCTVQRAQIISVAGVVATFDKSLGTAESTCTGRLGGAFALPADGLLELGVAGNTHWVKSGTYTQAAAAIDVAAAGTAAFPINLKGYVTNRTTVTNGTDRPTLIAGANGFKFSGANWVLENLIVTTTHADGLYINSINGVVQNVKVTNSGTGTKYGIRIAASYVKINNCESISTNGYGIGGSGSVTKLWGNYIHDSVHGIYDNGGVWIMAFNIIDTCSTAGINLTTTLDNNVIWQNTIYGAETPAGTGILGGDSESNLIGYNIIYGWTTGISFSANALNNIIDYNAWYNNTTNFTLATQGSHDYCTENSNAVDPGFVGAAAGDFSIGTGLKAKGFPGAFPGGLTTGYLDIGAVQRVEPAAGGGGGAWGF